MGEKRRHDGDEFTREAVRLVTEQGYGVSETAGHLGIQAQMLGRWTREVEAQPSAAFPGNGRVSPDQAEFQRVREDQKRLRLARDMFKTALGDCASGSHGGMPFLPSIRPCGRLRSWARCSTSVAVGFLRTCRDTPRGQARPRRLPSEPGSKRWPRTRVTVMVVVAWPNTSRMKGCTWAARRRGG